MKNKAFLLTLIFVLLFCINSFAEGQAGLGTFIAIIYFLSFCFYTIIGGLIIKLVLKLVKPNISNAKWLPFLVALLFAVMLSVFMDDLFIPFFWFDN